MSRVERLYRWHAPFYDLTRRPFLIDRERAVAALRLNGGERVIDFACGTGLNLPWLRRAGAAEVVGVDLTSAMLDRAGRRDREAQLVHGDIARVRLPGPPADCALCTYGLSLVPDWRAALRNMHAHLRPGGTLVVLDFDRLRGVLGALNPLLRAYFALFGVRPALPVTAELPGLFDECEAEPRHGGWVAIVTARGARPASAPGPPVRS